MICDKLDSNKHYIWKRRWKNKYESIWGLWEKFRYVNIPSAAHNSLISLRKEAVKYTFDDKILCLRKGPLNVDSPVYMWESGIPCLNKIVSPETLFYKKLKYCPICMKRGYHSILHQAKFLDECFIHNCKLIERCSCETGFSLEYKTNIVAFQCKKCKERINIISPAIDGISNNWKIKIPPHIINENGDKIKAIYYIDPNLILSNSLGTFSKNQKIALRNLVFEKRVEECTPKLVVNTEESAYPIKDYHKRFAFEIHEKYGLEYCNRQFRHVMRRLYVDKKEKIDCNVIAFFYTLKDLLLKEFADQVYPIHYGISDSEEDVIDNNFLQIAYSWRSWRSIVQYWRNNLSASQNIISNYMYKNLIDERYIDILDYLKEIYLSAIQLYELKIMYSKSKYSTYLIIEHEDGTIFLY